MTIVLRETYRGQKMKDILEQHRFWAMVAMIGMVMTLITGHQLAGGGKKKD